MRYSSTSRHRKAPCRISEATSTHAIHIFLTTSALLGTSVCIFKLQCPYSFVSDRMYLHKISQYRKWGNNIFYSTVSVTILWLLHEVISLAWIWADSALGCSEGAESFTQLYTAAACSLALQVSLTSYRGGNLSKWWLFCCSCTGRIPFITLLSPTKTGNMHFQKVLSLCSGCGLISIYYKEYNLVCSVLYWIQMNCSVISEVAFIADSLPFHKIRPFAVKSWFFCSLWEAESFMHQLKSNGNYV